MTSCWRNLAADGCFERSDLALTAFGQRAMAALNEARLVIDLVGTGRTSTHAAKRLARARGSSAAPTPLRCIPILRR